MKASSNSNLVLIIEGRTLNFTTPNLLKKRARKGKIERGNWRKHSHEKADP